MNNKRKVVAMGLMMFGSVMAFSQNLNPSNLTNSPYSRYGLGELGGVGNATTRGMGGLGIALRNSSYTNLANPASLTSIDTLTMIFDFGVEAELTEFSENGSRSTDWNAGFSYMSFHFPLWNNFAMSLSLTPFSTVGYHYGNDENSPIEGGLIADTLNTSNEYQGTGGTSRIMMGLGWKALHTKTSELNLGVNFGYVFGTISHGGYMYISSGQGQNTVITREFSAKGIELGLGLQYTQHIDAKQSVILGATFSPKTKLGIDATNLKYSNTDTTYFSNDIDVKSPMKYAIGATYIKDRQLTVGAEYGFEQWEKVDGLNANLQKASGVYGNTHRVALGAEYQPQVYSANYLKVIRYRVGANYKTSYCLINGEQNKEFGVSLGMGFPVSKNRRSYLNFSTEYTHVSPGNKNMLSENYLRFTLGMTFNEFMFFRNKLK